MKAIKLLSVTFLALMLFATTNVNSQPRENIDKTKRAELTEEQKAKIKDIRLASYKEIKALQNQMGELKAKQRTLTTADKPDLNAINGNIDEITKVEAKLMKIRAANHQQIRALLTDEQKMWFDSKGMKKGEHHKMGKHKGNKPFKGEAQHHEKNQKNS